MYIIEKLIFTFILSSIFEDLRVLSQLSKHDFDVEARRAHKRKKRPCIGRSNEGEGRTFLDVSFSYVDVDHNSNYLCGGGYPPVRPGHGGLLHGGGHHGGGLLGNHLGGGLLGHHHGGGLLANHFGGGPSGYYPPTPLGYPPIGAFPPPYYYGGGYPGGGYPGGGYPGGGYPRPPGGIAASTAQDNGQNDGAGQGLPQYGCGILGHRRCRPGEMPGTGGSGLLGNLLGNGPGGPQGSGVLGNLLGNGNGPGGPQGSGLLGNFLNNVPSNLLGSNPLGNVVGSSQGTGISPPLSDSNSNEVGSNNPLSNLFSQVTSQFGNNQNEGLFSGLFDGISNFFGGNNQPTNSRPPPVADPDPPSPAATPAPPIEEPEGDKPIPADYDEVQPDIIKPDTEQTTYRPFTQEANIQENPSNNGGWFFGLFDGSIFHGVFGNGQKPPYNPGDFGPNRPPFNSESDGSNKPVTETNDDIPEGNYYKPNPPILGYNPLNGMYVQGSPVMNRPRFSVLRQYRYRLPYKPC